MGSAAPHWLGEVQHPGFYNKVSERAKMEREGDRQRYREKEGSQTCALECVVGALGLTVQSFPLGASTRCSGTWPPAVWNMNNINNK